MKSEKIAEAGRGSKGLLQQVRNVGASGYVVKSNAARELIQAVETLLDVIPLQFLGSWQSASAES